VHESNVCASMAQLVLSTLTRARFGPRHPTELSFASRLNQ
jgi:hypothetical protein